MGMSGKNAKKRGCFVDNFFSEPLICWVLEGTFGCSFLE